MGAPTFTTRWVETPPAAPGPCRVQKAFLSNPEKACILLKLTTQSTHYPQVLRSVQWEPPLGPQLLPFLGPEGEADYNMLCATVNTAECLFVCYYIVT